MTQSNITKLRNADFRYSHILFRTNLQEANSHEIRMGILAELRVENIRVFGMTARTSLDVDEFVLLPDAWKESIKHPILYLEKAFYDAWDISRGAGGSAIDFMSEKYNGSLLAVPSTKIITPSFLKDSSDEDLLDDSILAVDEKLKEQARVFLGKSGPYFREEEEAKAA